MNSTILQITLNKLSGHSAPSAGIATVRRDDAAQIQIELDTARQLLDFAAQFVADAYRHRGDDEQASNLMSVYGGIDFGGDGRQLGIAGLSASSQFKNLATATTELFHAAQTLIESRKNVGLGAWPNADESSAVKNLRLYFTGRLVCSMSEAEFWQDGTPAQCGLEIGEQTKAKRANGDKRIAELLRKQFNVSAG